MESLSHQDGACDGQVVLAGDQRGATEVGGSADTLEDRGEGDEALDIGVREGVFASLVGGDASGLQGSGKELHVLLLVVGDVLKVGVVVFAVACGIVSLLRLLCIWKVRSRTGLLKVLSRKLLKGTLVEDILKVLESESELEDSCVDVGARDKGCGSGDGSQEGDGADDSVLHFGKSNDC